MKNFILMNGLELEGKELQAYYYVLSKKQKMLESIDCTNSNYLRKTDFRNCMMHFELKDKDENSLIAEKNFDLAIPFCGLVETQLYEKLNIYLGFDLL